VKKDINLGYALESCKFLYKSYIYENTKKIIYGSPFELILRKEREKKYGIKYPVLKKEYFNKELNKSKFEIPKNIIGIKNNDLEKYLVNLSEKNIDESKTWLRSNGGYKNLKFNDSKSFIKFWKSTTYYNPKHLKKIENCLQKRKNLAFTKISSIATIKKIS